MNRTKPPMIFLVNAVTSADFSGGDMFFVEIAKRLVRDGYTLHFVTGKLGEVIYSGSGLDTVIYHCSDTSSDEIRSPFGIIFAYMKRAITSIGIIRTLLRQYPDAVFVSTSNIYCDTLLYPFLGKVTVIPVLHMPAPNPFTGFEQTPHVPRIGEIHLYLSDLLSYILIRAYLYPRNCRLVTVTPQMRRLIGKIRLLAGFGVTIVPNGVNHPFPSHSVDRLTELKRTDFVWIGRDHRQKGIADLLEILSDIKAAKPDFRCTIIGAMTDAFAVELRKRSLDRNVTLTGSLTGPSKFQKLAEAKVMLFTSHFESYGIVVLENLACGNAVVGYDLDSSRENYPGLMDLVPRFDRRAFSKTALMALEAYPDRRRIRNGRNHAAEKSWESAYNTFIALLRN